LALGEPIYLGREGGREGGSEEGRVGGWEGGMQIEGKMRERGKRGRSNKEEREGERERAVPLRVVRVVAVPAGNGSAGDAHAEGTRSLRKEGRWGGREGGREGGRRKRGESFGGTIDLMARATLSLPPSLPWPGTCMPCSLHTTSRIHPPSPGWSGPWKSEERREGGREGGKEGGRELRGGRHREMEKWIERRR